MKNGFVQRPLLALVVTVVVQALASVSQSTPAVLAPVIAPQVGLQAEQIGLFTGLLYVFAMLSGLLCSSYVNRVGAVRLSQLSLLCAALGLAFMCVGSAPLLLLSAALVGVGYGVVNPTSAVILGAHATASKRGLIFSIKQTGVPIGVALAGLVVPALYHWLGWQGAVFAVAAFFVVTAVAIQPSIAIIDAPAYRSADALSMSFFKPLRAVFADRRLRRLGLVSLVYAFTQVCLLAFLVAYLHIELQMSLALAAAVLAVAQVTSIVGRPFWGWLADYWGQPARLLGLLGVAMGVACLALALMPTDAPLWQVFATAMACAATAIAWNGVFYAELVSHAQPAELATVTGGTQFMTFAGGMIGPVLFGLAVTVSGTYWIAFALLGVLPIVAGLSLLNGVRRDPPLVSVVSAK